MPEILPNELYILCEALEGEQQEKPSEMKPLCFITEEGGTRPIVWTAREGAEQFRTEKELPLSVGVVPTQEMNAAIETGTFAGLLVNPPPEEFNSPDTP